MQMVKRLQEEKILLTTERDHAVNKLLIFISKENIAQAEEGKEKVTAKTDEKVDWESDMNEMHDEFLRNSASKLDEDKGNKNPESTF